MNTDTTRSSDPNRALLFVHYNARGALADYVIFYLEALRPLFSFVVVVSNSPLSAIDTERVHSIADDVFERPNDGFDFSAWKESLERVGWDRLSEFDTVVLANDSCFGPVCPLEPVFDRMEHGENDFWALSDYPDAAFPYHLQSFFLAFRRPVVASTAFRAFWDRVAAATNVQDVIDRYESRLTSYLRDAGFRSDVAFSFPSVAGKDPNAATWRPVEALDRGLPLVKVKAFLTSGEPHLLFDLIRNYNSHLAGVVRRHLKTAFPPEVAASLPSVPFSGDPAQSLHAGDSISPVFLLVAHDPSAISRVSEHIDRRFPRERVRHVFGEERPESAWETLPDGDPIFVLFLDKSCGPVAVHHANLAGIELIQRRYDSVVDSFRSDDCLGLVMPDTPPGLVPGENDPSFAPCLPVWVRRDLLLLVADHPVASWPHILQDHGYFTDLMPVSYAASAPVFQTALAYRRRIARLEQRIERLRSGYIRIPTPRTIARVAARTFRRRRRHRRAVR